MFNSIEQARLELGLTEPQMLKALGAKPGRATLFVVGDANVDPVFLERAKELTSAYRLWVGERKREISDAAASSGISVGNIPALTATQVARILGLSEFNVVKMAERGLIDSVQLPRRVYPITAIYAFIDGNSQHLGPNSRRSRGPLATSFLTWFESESRSPALSLS